MDLLLVVLIAAIIGLVAGYIGGLLGVGGGIIMVPALVLVLDVGFHDAKAASLFAILILSAFGSHTHRSLGNVDRAMGIQLGVTGALGAIIGSYVSILVSPKVLIVIFVITLFLSAARFFVKVKEREVGKVWVVPVIGLGGGFIAGLLGVGGGIVMVQGMVYIGVAMHTAVGTSLLAIVFNAASGVCSHAYLGFMDLAVAIPLTVAAVVGVKGGSIHCDKVQAPVLKRYFGVVMVLVGIYLILRTFGLILIG